MDYFLFLAVIIKENRNPFRPFSYIDRGHVDIVLWHPPELPQSYGFYPVSKYRAFISLISPQRANLVKKNTFTTVPSYWYKWEISKSKFYEVKNYLEHIYVSCKEGTVKYDAFKFNCLHVAYRCLEIAGLNPPIIPAKRIFIFKTIIPNSFIEIIMPKAHYSVMYHDIAKMTDNCYKIPSSVDNIKKSINLPTKQSPKSG